MILSMASDLNTRQIVWAGRQTNDAPQTMGMDVPITVEAVWIAGSYAQTYADDVVPVTFE